MTGSVPINIPTLLHSQALKLAQTPQQHGHIITDGSMSPLPMLGGKIRLGVTDVCLCIEVQAQGCEGWPNFSLPLLVSCLSEKLSPLETSVSLSAACLSGLKSGSGPCVFLSTMAELFHNVAFYTSNLTSTARARW